jgi:hypothetical protein
MSFSDIFMRQKNITKKNLEKNHLSYEHQTQEGLKVEFKPNFFQDEGFDDFAIFDSTRGISLESLKNYSKSPEEVVEVFKNSMDPEICELLIYNELSETKHLTYRTVIHCINEDHEALFEELLSLHEKFHNQALRNLESSKKP